MNYRHAFHAGNFADLGKHAILTHIMRALTTRRQPLTVVDTHAGAGVYDLEGAQAKRTGEATVHRLVDAPDAPAVFDALKAVIRRLNQNDRVRYYPGSPLLITQWLRPRDTFIACELRSDDHDALKAVLPPRAGSEVLKADGWLTALARSPAGPASLLVFIDPPYERPDDQAQALAVAARVLRRNSDAVVVIWLPIKDLAGFDYFLTGAEDLAGRRSILVAETRLRPLNDPMLMNGCALVVFNPPPELQAAARAAVEWVAQTVGEGQGEGRVSLLSVDVGI